MTRVTLTPVIHIIACVADHSPMLTPSIPHTPPVLPCPHSTHAMSETSSWNDDLPSSGESPEKLRSIKAS